VMLSTGNNLDETYTRVEVNYHGQPVPVNISFYNYDGGYSGGDSLTYKFNRLDTLYQYERDYQGSTPKLVKKFAYTWDGKGNIIKMDKIYVDDPANVNITTTTFVYDNKTNPAKALAGYYIVNFDE